MSHDQASEEHGSIPGLMTHTPYLLGRATDDGQIS